MHRNGGTVLLHPLRGAAALLIAVAIATPVEAQNTHGGTGTAPANSSVDSLQTALEGLLDVDKTAVIHNWRVGTAGKGKWDMVRRLSSAQRVRRCYTRLNTPDLVSNSGIAAGDIAKAYDIDWSLIGTVVSNGPRVKFTAAHMTSDEYGELTFGDPGEAQMVRDAFEQIRDKCKA